MAPNAEADPERGSFSSPSGHKDATKAYKHHKLLQFETASKFLTMDQNGVNNFGVAFSDCHNLKGILFQASDRLGYGTVRRPQWGKEQCERRPGVGFFCYKYVVPFSHAEAL